MRQYRRCAVQMEEVSGMDDRMHLQVITPEKSVCDSACASVRLPLADGSAGILPGHAPLMGVVESGIVHYTAKGEKHYVAVKNGTVHVWKNEVLLLVEAAAEAEDDARAREALGQII